jgi:hypothetical protein
LEEPSKKISARQRQNMYIGTLAPGTEGFVKNHEKKPWSIPSKNNHVGEPCKNAPCVNQVKKSKVGFLVKSNTERDISPG